MKRSQKEKDLRIWMMGRDLEVCDLAAGVGVTSSMISHYLAGRKQSKRVDGYLLYIGCPPGLLGLTPEEAKTIMEFYIYKGSAK